MDDSLLRKLLALADAGVCPMHMPGHKRNTALLGTDLPYALDITEIDGFDNLQAPEGILRDMEERAAALYGSRAAFLSVNGSTGALLAAVRAAAAPGDTVLMARNCHKAVYAAAEVCGLRPVYLLPPADGETGIAGSVTPEAVRTALDAHPEVRLVVLTSPTYEGVESDVRSVAAAAHARGVPLLVDAAHGAHLGFHPDFGESAVACGADLTAMSLHKTLPALTPCALLHVSGSLVSPRDVRRALSLFQTTSPSYVLMASADACLRLLEARGVELFGAYAARLRTLCGQLRGLAHLRLLDADGKARPAFFARDPGKLLVLTRYAAGLTGPALATALRERCAVETEMAAASFVLAMTGICDTEENFCRFAAALSELDGALTSGDAGAPPAPPLPEAVMPPFEAARLRGVPLPLAAAAGRTALEYVWAYPPGVPLLAPGERVPAAFPDFCRETRSRGVTLHATEPGFPEYLLCAP